MPSIFRTVALDQHWSLSIVCAADALHLNNMDSIPSSKTMVCVAFEQHDMLRASINCRITLIFQEIAHFMPGKSSVSVVNLQISVTEGVLYLAGRCI